MKNAEKSDAIGIFSMKIYKAGNLIEEYEDRNLIVTQGKYSLAHLLAGDGGGMQVDKISFGTNGTPPATGDTSIASVLVKAINSHSYPTSNSVAFVWSLETAEGNGSNIAEFGLLTDSNTLFARKSRAIISKDTDIRIDGTWTIIF